MTPKPNDIKRAEAERRNAQWAGLHWTTKLDRLHHRPGFSKRQRDRIMEALTREQRRTVVERAS